MNDASNASLKSNPNSVLPVSVWERVVFALLLAITVGLGTQFASPLFIDCEHWDINIYHTIGREMLDGAVPYKDLVDHKGPLLHFIFALAAMLNPSPDSLTGLMIVLIGFYFIAFFFTEKIARLFIDGWYPQIVTCIFALVLFETIFQAQAIDFIFPLHVASFFYLARCLVQNSRPAPVIWFFWGICFSCAFLIKIPYAIAWGFAPFFWLTLSFGRNIDWGRSFKDGLALFLGVVTTILIFVVYFLAVGGLHDFFYWYFEFNTLYPETSLKSILEQQIYQVYFQLPEYILAFVGALLPLRYFQTPLQKIVYASAFVFCFIGMALPGRNTYVHCMAPFVAMGIIALVAIFAQRVSIRKSHAMFVCAVLAIITVWNIGYLPRRWDGIAPNPIRDRDFRFVAASNFEKIKRELHLKETSGTLFAPLEPVFYRISGLNVADKFFFPPSVSEKKFPETWQSFQRTIDEQRADWIILPSNYESFFWTKRITDNYDLVRITKDGSRVIFRKKSK